MIYLASSWRNQYQPAVLALIRAWGFDVYDFRNPAEGNHGFAACDYPSWQSGTTAGFNQALTLPEPKQALDLDMDALRSASCVVMLLPCGKSAHIEAGYAIGAGVPLIVYSPANERFEPELMYGGAGLVTDSLTELACFLNKMATAGAQR